jgi:hypothetical protein
MGNRLYGLGEEWFLLPHIFAITRDAHGGSISNICANDAIYDTTCNFTSSIDESGASERQDK